jgi:hypothetical protein
VLTVLAPDDEPHAGGGGATHGHRRAGLRLHDGSLLWVRFREYGRGSRRNLLFPTEATADQR